MKLSSASAFGVLDRIAIGATRATIRRASTARPSKKKKGTTGFKPGHGEDIYVFHHVEEGMVVYSHKPELKRESTRLLDQIAFTVKKQKPAVFRKDYWRPLCMIRFGPGQGVVGRNVFQKLRELRALHELDWGWQKEEFQKLDRWTRGQRIHDQKANAIADIAHVLEGKGRGNLMWTTAPEPMAKDEAEAEAETKAADETPGTASAPTEATKALPEETPRRLQNVSIYWANDTDFGWARHWSPNVSHLAGLPEGVEVWNWQTKRLRNPAEGIDSHLRGRPLKLKLNAPIPISDKPAPIEDTSSYDEQLQQMEKEKAEEREKEKKKSWLGWLGSKTGISSMGARP